MTDAGEEVAGGALEAPEARSRLLSVFRFIQALNNRRNPPQRLIENQPWQFWRSDLPDHTSVEIASVVDNGAGPATDVPEDVEDAQAKTLISVARPELTPPPSPPAMLTEWMLRGWDDPFRDAEVRESINAQDASGETRIVRFGDDSQRPAALAAWVGVRAQWAVAERPAREAMRCFERFYELWSLVERDAESVELVLGEGVLEWAHAAGRLHHPLLLQRVDLHFDTAAAEFTVTETDSLPELYSALLQSVPEVDGLALGTVREELAAGVFHPLGGDATSGFLRSAIIRLSPRGLYLADEDQPLPSGDIPSIRRAPVLFLRPRTSGFAACIQEVLNELGKGGFIPPSLIGIVGDPDHLLQREMGDGVAAGGEVSSEPRADSEQILFSLPANPEQLRIAQRLAADGAVLVQGPPGTGKTHTIANLLGHLLAQGKSVLVTSHTTKALRVLRDKVVKQLEPLCISVLDSDAEGRSQLKGSVEAITERLSRTDIKQSERRAGALAQERLHLEGQALKRTGELMQASADEYRPIVLGGKSYEPSPAARLVAERKETDSWIPAPISIGAPMPLSAAEVARLYAISSELPAEAEREIDQSLPDPSLLLRADEFASLVEARTSLEREDREPNSRAWVSPLAPLAPEAIESALERASLVIEELPEAEPWKMAVALAGLRGAMCRAPWEQLLDFVTSTRELSGKAQAALVAHAPALAQTDEPEIRLAVLREMLAHLKSGKKLGAIYLTLRPRWKKLLGQVSVRERMPQLPEHFEALELAAQIELERAELGRRWDALVGPHDGPRARDLGIELEYSLETMASALRSLLNWNTDRWLVARDALVGLGFAWEAFEQDHPPEAGQSQELTRLVRTVRERLPAVLRPKLAQLRWAEIESRLASWRAVLDAHEVTHGTLSETSRAIARSLRVLSVQEYQVAYTRLLELWKSRALRDERGRLLERLQSAAPGWARAVARRTEAHGNAKPPGDPERAWLWRQLHDELCLRSQTSIADLQAEIGAIRDRTRSVTSDLISCSAWASQAKRTSLRQRQALFGWLDAVKRLGKHGTVKRAALLKHQVQENLKDARSAVPVWIMPVSRVVESFMPSQARFDVAIIDEASQSDLSALVVLFMARSVVIVGDHEQVSPVAVGQDESWVMQLIKEHLAEVPNNALFGGRLSVYDLARHSFAEAICLVEHFRCVPEIIAFSNQLSYENRVKPLREPGSAQLRPHLVPYRVESTSPAGKTNKEEALAVSSLLLAACEEPSYADATFGVISMVAEDTAREVDTILRRRLDAPSYQRRRIRCGNPAQFQGDERDVMFVAMVDTPEGGPKSLRDSADWKKRFNVAASRARDQMWVVYSLDPQTDLKPGDLRKRLIDHALDPQAIMRSIEIAVARAESTFEVAVIQRLVGAGYRIRPQYQVGHYRIDIVVEGRAVEGRTPRLAVECDGDRYHPPEKLAEDLARQEVLERMGWRFVRIRGSSFGLNPEVAMQPVFDALEELWIERLGPEPEKSHEAKESELIARVTRRAAELRAAWAAEDPETPEPEARATRPGFGHWRRRRRATEPEVPVQPRAAGAVQGTDVTSAESTQQVLGLDGAVSSNQPANQATTGLSLATLLSAHGLKSADGRSKGDPLYVDTDDSNGEVSRQLRARGFTYNRHTKRWWTRAPGKL